MGTRPKQQILTLIAIALTFCSGANDVASFTRLGGVFTSVMTGNIVLWGLSAAERSVSLFSHTAVSIAGYITGVACGTWVAHGKQAGTVPGGLLRWAEEVLSPKVNWRAVLAAELRRAIAEVSGAVDYSYRRPSRRSAVAGPVVLPALRRPVPEVAVVCDTSGSMTEDLLAMVLAEVEGLLRALGLARQVRVLACDTAVAPAQRVSSARQVQLIGGGGTDMGAGIGAAAALRPRPAVTVVLTDGYTPWPEQAPKGMRVVVGLIGDQAPEAPSWTRSVRVPAD